ncbi:hypothetical protein JTB14_000048 [Gonioctena quinquepunctata]|nr:hypothetical protein JTB14_000048 [Gonioctena quinquepunctata]
MPFKHEYKSDRRSIPTGIIRRAIKEVSESNNMKTTAKYDIAGPSYKRYLKAKENVKASEKNIRKYLQSVYLGKSDKLSYGLTKLQTRTLA